MKRALGVFTISVAILIAAGCDPATIQKAKRTTTQKVADAKESVEPVLDQAGKKLSEAKDTVKQKAGEFADKAREAGAQVNTSSCMHCHSGPAAVDMSYLFLNNAD